MVATQSLSRLVILSEDARPSRRICGWPDDWAAGVVASYQLRGVLVANGRRPLLVFWQPLSGITLFYRNRQHRTQRANLALRLLFQAIMFSHLHQKSVHFVVNLRQRTALRGAHRP